MKLDTSENPQSGFGPRFATLDVYVDDEGGDPLGAVLGGGLDDAVERVLDGDHGRAIGHCCAALGLGAGTQEITAFDERRGKHCAVA